MYKINNFTRPYLFDISSFSSLILGKKTLTEEELEEYIYNDDKFCKLALDTLKETLGFMACSIVDPKQYNLLLREKATEKVGFIHTAAIAPFGENQNIESILIEHCINELKLRGVTIVYTLVDAKQVNLIEALESFNFSPNGFHDQYVLYVKK